MAEQKKKKQGGRIPVTLLFFRGLIGCYLVWLGWGLRKTALSGEEGSLPMLAAMILFIAGSVLISMIENIPMRSTLFECASAVATVGLSLGITPTLGIASKIILCIIMYTGRVGGLTLVFAAVARRKVYAGQYPEDHIAVG